MGSYITLDIGELNLDWGKNFSFNDYSKLFLPSDKTKIPYHYADNKTELEPGYSSTLEKVLSRLELLGYSLENLKTNLEENEDFFPEYLEQPKMDFNLILELFKNLDLNDYKDKYEIPDYNIGVYFYEKIFTDEKFEHLRELDPLKELDIGFYFQNLDPLYILRLLIENKNNHHLKLLWRTNDIVVGGWINEENIYVGLEKSDKYLIVTEGSSDTFILKRALNLLRPDIVDFFTFVDMEENYPFTGTGNLYKFCQGLSSIDILNKVLIIFDNDLEGNESFEKTRNLSKPKNLRVMKLPVLEEFNSILTVGPTGEAYENINGKAVSIECFLDFNQEQPKVRWTNYKKRSNSYQGSLTNKDNYTRSFKKIRNLDLEYDFTKLNKLIESIYKNCI